MKATPVPLDSLASYASLQLLHERFLLNGASLPALFATRSDFSLCEQVEFDKFKLSPFGRWGEFQKYCAVRESEILAIPRPAMAGRRKSGLPARTCMECVSKNDPTGVACNVCLASLDNAFAESGVSQSSSENCSGSKGGICLGTCKLASQRGNPVC